MTQGFLQSRSGWPFLTVYNICFYIIHILLGAQILPLQSRLYFQRALLASQEHQAEGTGISYKPCAGTHAQTPHYEHPPADWDICHSEVTSLHVIITQSPELTSGITLGVVEFMSLDKGTKTCVCHYRILQNVFFGLISNDPPLHDSPPTHPLQTQRFLLSPSLCPSETVMELEPYSVGTFQIGSIHGLICTCIACSSFPGLIAYFRFMLSDSPSMDPLISFFI